MGPVQKAKAKVGGGPDGAGGQQLGAPFPLLVAVRSGRYREEKETLYPHYTARETESRRMGGVASLWHGNPVARGDLNS